MDSKNSDVKTAIEVGTLAGQLNATDQSYVLNTVNALLFSQQVNVPEPMDPEEEKGITWQDKSG